jgi:hypothetical protein
MQVDYAIILQSEWCCPSFFLLEYAFGFGICSIGSIFTKHCKSSGIWQILACTIDAMIERVAACLLRDQEDHWCHQFIQHLYKATSSDGFPNPATRANVVDKMMIHIHARRRGNAILPELLGDQHRPAYV